MGLCRSDIRDLIALTVILQYVPGNKMHFILLKC